MESDYIGCLKLLMNGAKLNCASDVIKITARVKKLLFDK